MDNGETASSVRAVGRSENPGVPVVMWGHNLPSALLVEIGLTDMPKFEGAMAPLAPTRTTGLSVNHERRVHVACAVHCAGATCD